MNCPACGTEGSSEVLKSFAFGRSVMRKRECECGATWKTKETAVKGTLVAKPRRPDLANEVSISSLSSVSDPDQTPDSSEQIRAGAREAKNTRIGRGDAKEYPAEFERLWQGCTGKRGNKLPAFKAWVKHKPDTTLTVAAYHRMVASLEPWRTVKDLSRWLNVKGWEDEYTPYVAPPANGHRRETWQQESARIERERAAAEKERIRRAEVEAQQLLNNLAEAKA